MILDTNSLSALADGNPVVDATVLRAEVVAIPVIVLGEFQFGIANSRLRRQYEPWLAEAMAICRILPIDEYTAA